MRLKLKICGMKYSENILEVAKLQPDYLGFIFYEKSKRNFEVEIPLISENIKKTGVFVDETIDSVLEKINKYQLKAVQLHGNESPDYCKKLTTTQVEVIKVFSVGDDFDLNLLKKYEEVCDYYLFDTKGNEKGGNGITFNWKLLNQYSSKKPYFLSGGIGLNEIEEVKEFLNTNASKYCCSLDVNSKFEDKPGLKNVQDLKIFIQELKLQQ